MIAILCPGPSLHQTWPAAEKDQYTHVYAVNQASCYYPHDWFCCQDTVAIEMFDPKPNKGIISTYVTWKRYHDRYACLIWPHAPFKHHRYTTPQAIGAASLFDPAEVHLYGADMEGSLYCDGTEHPQSHPPAERWRRETTDIQNFVRWTQLKLLRVLPTGQKVSA